MQNQISNNWQKVKIEEVCKVASGSTPRTEKLSFWNGEIPWITPMDLSKLHSKYVVKGTRSITEDGLRNCSAELVPPYSLIMSSRAPIGYFAINIKQATTNQGCKTFICGDKVYVDFLYYYLAFHLEEIKRLSSGSTFAEVGKKQLESFTIELPQLITQKEISAVLSSVDDAIYSIDQIIQKTKILKQELTKTLLANGIEHKEFKKTRVGVIPGNWNVVSLKEVIKITSGQVNPKNEPYSSMVLLAPNHIESTSGRILERVSAKVQQAISGKYLVENGDVVYSKIRPYLKKVTIADTDCLCSADMYPIKGLPNLDNKFLFHILLSERFTNYANNSSGRTGIPKLNREELGNYIFALPPLKEQEVISSILSSVDRKISINQEIKDKYIFLKNGLMQDIFTQKIQINQL